MHVALRKRNADAARVQRFLAALYQIEFGAPPVGTRRLNPEQDVYRTVAELVHLDQRFRIRQDARLVRGNLLQDAYGQADIVAIGDAIVLIDTPDVLVAPQIVELGKNAIGPSGRCALQMKKPSESMM
jgi:hypothetical protein